MAKQIEKAEVDVESRIRHLLKTATRANESSNYVREAQLTEEALALSSDVNAQVLRRYASALYKIGEFRAAAILANSELLKDGNPEFVERLKDMVEEKGASQFLTILDRFGI
ncbi:MAG: hypothetical protein AAF296_02280 [Pseudomonadota bacterium]